MEEQVGRIQQNYETDEEKYYAINGADPNPILDRNTLKGKIDERELDKDKLKNLEEGISIPLPNPTKDRVYDYQVHNRNEIFQNTEVLERAVRAKWANQFPRERILCFVRVGCMSNLLFPLLNSDQHISKVFNYQWTKENDTFSIWEPHSSSVSHNTSKNRDVVLGHLVEDYMLKKSAADEKGRITVGKDELYKITRLNLDNVDVFLSKQMDLFRKKNDKEEKLEEIECKGWNGSLKTFENHRFYKEALIKAALSGIKKLLIVFISEKNKEWNISRAQWITLPKDYLDRVRTITINILKRLIHKTTTNSTYTKGKIEVGWDDETLQPFLNIIYGNGQKSQFIFNRGNGTLTGASRQNTSDCDSNNYEDFTDFSVVSNNPYKSKKDHIERRIQRLKKTNKKPFRSTEERDHSPLGKRKRKQTDRDSDDDYGGCGYLGISL